jgi:hypothetical protein
VEEEEGGGGGGRGRRSWLGWDEMGWDGGFNSVGWKVGILWFLLGQFIWGFRLRRGI